MFRRSINLHFCIFLALITTSDCSHPDSVTGSDPEVTVYRLRTNNPGGMIQDDNVAKMADNLEELIMEHDYEREFLKDMTHSTSFVEKLTAVPYYVSETSQEDHCLENNGNCSQICETVGLQTVCSCREGYTLTSTTACSEISTCEIVVSGTSGEFTIDKKNCQWLIKAPDRHIIKTTLEITSGYDHRGYRYGYTDISYAEVYDGSSTGAKLISNIRPYTRETVLLSSGQNMLIKSQQGIHYDSYTLRVSYVTGFQHLEMEYIDTGSLVVPISSLTKGDDCLSLTYSTPGPNSLMVNLNKKYGEKLQVLHPEFTFEHRDRKLKTEVFRIPFLEGAEELEFQFYRKGIKVYNLGRCLNFEYLAISGHHSVGPETVCRNGGMWNNVTQSCTCPPGFVGAYCEEGCGPNRYGENCSKLCSFLASACEGMIFCTKEWCSCAPGLQGVKCDSPCPSGYYGASCRQQCGNCRYNLRCDRYTGICYSGCSTGFYPPFCQQSPQVFVSAPDIVATTYNSLKIRISFENVTGEEGPITYEIQYKEEEEELWSKLSRRTIPNETEYGIIAESEILGLLPGKVYETQVILIDNIGRSFQTDVPKSKARTKCIDPVHGEYKFAATDVSETSILLHWSYEHDQTSLICEIVEFELSVFCGSEKLIFVLTNEERWKSISNIMPDMTYIIQLTGKTVTGKKTLPEEISVHTLPAAPGRVRGVTAMPSVSGRQLNVTWLSPWNSQGESLRYRVTYKCDYLLACGEDVGCYTKSHGDTELSTTSVVLDHLEPHAVYLIKIESVSLGGLLSESYITYGVTAHSAPQVAPSAAENPIIAVTNTSVSLTWKPPEDCSALNGYIYGYSYSLVENNTENSVKEGTVPENILSVNVTDLVPSLCYNAYIRVVSSGGTSLSDLLVIPFCTSSTAPDRVQSLSVYKRGRRMVGLRWSPPLNAYGDIEFFTITYGIQGSSHNREVTTEPKHCGAWVDLYCYTVSGLKPGKKYHFEVQARNKEVNIDGEPTSVEAITVEGASTPPLNLRVINATESSLLVEWSMPDNINGQLRSFIIIVEQIDSQGNSDECCDEIPLQDYRVTSEEPFYQYEITGLSAASTYSVAVSAKTLTLGEESRVLGYTYPPKASLPQNALIIVETESSSYIPDVVTLQMHPAERISNINRTYILLYLTNDSTTQQPFDDGELATLLQSRFTENYHLLSEYTQEEVENQPVVTFSLKEQGFVSAEIQSQKYALILIQDYMGNRNMDIFVTEETGI